MNFEERINMLYQEVKADFEKLNIGYSDNVICIKVNSRAKSRFGCCKRKKLIGKEEGFVIEISSFLETAENEILKNIIAHELLHTVPGCYDHGPKWKSLADRLSTQGYMIKRTTTYELSGVEDPRSQIRDRYQITCQKCGKVFYRKRKCKLTENTNYYRCGECGGRLKCKEL